MNVSRSILVILGIGIVLSAIIAFQDEVYAQSPEDGGPVDREGSGSQGTGPEDGGPTDRTTPTQTPVQPTATPTQTPAQPTPISQPPVCTPSWRDLYPECKPGTNLACKVQQDTCSGEYRYVDCWQQPGVCGNPPASQPQQPTQPAVCTLQNETYPECGSWCGTQGRQPVDVLSIVTRTVIDRNACSAVYSCDIRGRVPGQCGVPVTQPVRTAQQPIMQQPIVQQPARQPIQVVQQPVVQPTPTTTVAVQVPAPLQNQAATLNCPAGQLPQVINSTVVCVQVQQQQNQTQTVLAYGGNANATGGSVNLTVPQPQVITAGYTTYAAELPKTGLPLGVWAFGALTPIGVVIRKLSSGLKNSLNKPVSIWQMREFLRGS